MNKYFQTRLIIKTTALILTEFCTTNKYSSMVQTCTTNLRWLMAPQRKRNEILPCFGNGLTDLNNICHDGT